MDGGALVKRLQSARLIFAGALLSAFALADAATAPPAKEVPCAATRGRTTYKVQTRCMRVTIADTVRTYRLYAPRAASKEPMPIVLALHGGGGSGSTMEAMTKGQFNRIADKHRVLIVYPDGVGRSWNDGRADPQSEAAQKNVDDIAFLRAVVADVEKKHPVNRARVFATGMSNGGLLSYRLACDASDFVAAVAAVAANMSQELAASCNPARMLPLLIVNGTDDPIMPWLGGPMKILGVNRGEVLSAPETFEHWTAIGDCALPDTGMPRDRVANDGTKFIRHLARECRDGAEVRLYELVGGGHTWPGGDATLGERSSGKVSKEINAAESIWEFFSKYGRKPREQ